MSAFAARQQLWGAAAAPATPATRAGSPEKATPKPATENEANQSKRGTTPLARPVATRRSRRQPAEQPAPIDVKQQPQSIEGERGLSGEDSTTSPHPEPGGILVRQHSSFKPDKKNLQRKAGGRLVISTRQGEVSFIDTLSR